MSYFNLQPSKTDLSNMKLRGENTVCKVEN